MAPRSEDSRENGSLRFVLVAICAASLFLLGVPAQAQRQVLKTRMAAPPNAPAGCAGTGTASGAQNADGRASKRSPGWSIASDPAAKFSANSASTERRTTRVADPAAL